jgi:uncharacterized membrane protein YjgN (DUF898 family)
MTVFDAAATAGPASVPVVPAAGPAARFTGDARAFWRIQLRGAVLLALTLGIYRFWLATDVRRFLWAHTEVRDESLEYTGTALELLIGFLVAIAILIPVYVFFFAATLGMGPVGQALSALAFPLLAFLGQFGYFRARRYRLTRTVFRGVRFHQSGSALRYAACTMVWWLLLLLTLGLAYPFMRAQLERYKMRHTYFGDLAGRFDGSALSLLLRGLPMWLLVMGPVAVALLAFVTIDWDAVIEASSRGGRDVLWDMEQASPGFHGTVFVIALSFGAAILLALLLFPAFQAMTTRWWASGVRLGPLVFRSHLPTRRIYGAYLRLVLFAVLLLVGLAALAFGLVFLYMATFGWALDSDTNEVLGTLGAVALYVVTMLGLSAIYQATAKLALWRQTVDTAEIEGLAVLDRVRSEGAPSSALGEGLADALNVGGI